MEYLVSFMFKLQYEKSNGLITRWSFEFVKRVREQCSVKKVACGRGLCSSLHKVKIYFFPSFLFILYHISYVHVSSKCIMKQYQITFPLPVYRLFLTNTTMTIAVVKYYNNTFLLLVQRVFLTNSTNAVMKQYENIIWQFAVCSSPHIK